MSELFYNNDCAKEEITQVKNIEPAKAILESTRKAMDELEMVLSSIDSAIHGTSAMQDKIADMPDDTMLNTLHKNRDKIIMILGIANHIREGLW